MASFNPTSFGDVGPKWWKFQRAYTRLGAFMFPGTGGFNGPMQIRDDVQLVEPLYRSTIGHDVRFDFDNQVAATGGVATTLTHPEPPAGFFHIPLMWSITYDGAVNQPVQAQFALTGSVLDPWGRFPMAGTTVFTGARCSAQRPVNLASIPYMRGVQLQALFPTPAAATNVTSALWYLECPAECCTLEFWRSLFGNFVNNAALP